MKKNILEQIKTLIETTCNGSETAFAKRIGVPQPTVNRKLRSADDKKLLELVGNILVAYQNINPMWLLNGEGEMYQPERAVPPAEGVQALAKRLDALEARLAAQEAKADRSAAASPARPALGAGSAARMPHTGGSE